MDEIAKLRTRLLVHRSLLVAVLADRADLDELALLSTAADQLERQEGDPERAAIYRDEVDRLITSAKLVRSRSSNGGQKSS